MKVIVVFDRSERIRTCYQSNTELTKKCPLNTAGFCLVIIVCFAFYKYSAPGQHNSGEDAGLESRTLKYLPFTPFTTVFGPHITSILYCLFSIYPVLTQSKSLPSRGGGIEGPYPPIPPIDLQSWVLPPMGVGWDGSPGGHSSLIPPGIH